jgi:hypothetical protein
MTSRFFYIFFGVGIVYIVGSSEILEF